MTPDEDSPGPARKPIVVGLSIDWHAGIATLWSDSTGTSMDILIEEAGAFAAVLQDLKSRRIALRGPVVDLPG